MKHLFIAILVAGILQAVPKQANKPDSNQNDGKHAPETPTKSLTAIHTQPSPREEENRADNEAKQSSWREKVLSPVVSNWPLIAIAVWGILVAIRTIKAIKEQTEATRIAADATRKSVEIIINQERPRIRIEPQEPKLDWKSVSSVPFEIDCWCPTLAFITNAQVEAYITAIAPREPYYIPINPPNPIQETTKLTMYAVIYETLTEETLSNKKVQVYFRGFIEYRGIHLSDSDPPYRTTFHRRWIPLAGIRLPEMPNGYWEEYGKPEDNQQT